MKSLFHNKLPEVCDSSSGELRKQTNKKLRLNVGLNQISNRRQANATIKQTNL